MTPSTEAGLSPSPQTARAIIRSLTRGTAISSGVRFLHVGHSKWLAAQYELLDELAADGHADTKFVRGAYGAGKSHFLSVVQDHARNAGWMTTHVECKIDGVQIDRFETLYSKLVGKLSAAKFVSNEDGRSSQNVIRELLDRWAAELLKKVGVSLTGLRRPFDSEERSYRHLNENLFRSNLPPEFTKALAVYARATLADDYDVKVAITNWLQGAEGRFRIPDHYLSKPVIGHRKTTSFVDLKPIGKGTAREVMRGILWLVRATGFKGLVLCIDEVEEIGKLGNRRREDQALQALRDFVDNAGSEVGFQHFCMYLAATPEMFDNPDYFPRYDALATRIQPVGSEINWRAPVVDLDRTPLQPTELNEMALKIRGIHQIAYPNGATDFTNAVVTDFVTEVNKSRVRIAKPRLLARLLVDELERARQRGHHTYASTEQLALAVQQTAEKILKETNG